MTHSAAIVYVHEPVSPFHAIKQIVGVRGVTKQVGLSKDTTVSFTVSISDIDDMRWLIPGMCWRIDQSWLGEDDWAGFVAPEEIPLDASEITINLRGPKDALLQQPLAPELPAVIGVTAAVEAALITAQSQGSPMLAGKFTDVGPATPLSVRGETVSQFINSMEQISICDFQERVEVTDQGLEFFLDFGVLENYTNVTLRRSDLVIGKFRSQPVPSTLTAFGAAGAFSERPRVTITPEQNPSGAGQSISRQADDRYRRLLVERAIGPAAIIHVNEINDRFGEGFEQIAYQRHQTLLSQVEEFYLTLENNENTRQLSLGDVFTLSVQDWVEGLDVEAELHVRLIDPQDDVGVRDIVASRMF